MPTKKQLRSERTLKNRTKQKGKFPDVLLKVVDVSDIILEILDARFIHETRNRNIEKLIHKKKKKIIYVLNKADLAKKREVKGLYPYVFISCKERRGAKELRDRIKIEAQRVEVPPGYEKIHVGVIGYPNSGKSSVINLLSGKGSAKIASEAGFTKGIQKIRLTSEILLLDSPGVIPVEEYSQDEMEKISQHTKVGGRDYGKVRNPEIIVSSIMQEYSKQIEKYYGINADGDSELLIEELGKKLNFLKKGGIVDEDKVARKILKDWQEGEIRI